MVVIVSASTLCKNGYNRTIESPILSGSAMLKVLRRNAQPMPRLQLTMAATRTTQKIFQCCFKRWYARL